MGNNNSSLNDPLEEQIRKNHIDIISNRDDDNEEMMYNIKQYGGLSSNIPLSINEYNKQHNINEYNKQYNDEYNNEESQDYQQSGSGTTNTTNDPLHKQLNADYPEEYKEFKDVANDDLEETYLSKMTGGGYSLNKPLPPTPQSIYQNQMMSQPYPGRFPGQFPGRFPGQFPGQFPGRFPGQYPGVPMQPQLPLGASGAPVAPPYPGAQSQMPMGQPLAMQPQIAQQQAIQQQAVMQQQAAQAAQAAQAEQRAQAAQAAQRAQAAQAAQAAQ
ncbi:MAG: hypothetical protein WD512_17750, partial [Candidatus Paceibacterota bacterium]